VAASGDQRDLVVVGGGGIWCVVVVIRGITLVVMVSHRVVMLCQQCVIKPVQVSHIPPALHCTYLCIVTSAQLRSMCDVWLAAKASLQTVHHVLHAASESGS
jgi:hypothetical protein